MLSEAEAREVAFRLIAETMRQLSHNTDVIQNLPEVSDVDDVDMVKDEIRALRDLFLSSDWHEY